MAADLRTITPRSDTDRCVCWCHVCVTHVNDQPDWAAEHHAKTGHTTHRRQWRVQTWETSR